MNNDFIGVRGESKPRLLEVDERKRVIQMHNELLRYLTPVLGEATAENMLKHYCARLNIPVDDIKETDLPELAVSMKPMLAVWLGSAGASRVAEEIARLGKGGVS